MAVVRICVSVEFVKLFGKCVVQIVWKICGKHRRTSMPFMNVGYF
jgi:hypothetical protein